MITGAQIVEIEKFISLAIPYFNPFIVCLLILISFGIFTYYTAKRDKGITYLAYGIFSLICCGNVLTSFSNFGGLEQVQNSVITLSIFFLIMGILGIIEFTKKVIM